MTLAQKIAQALEAAPDPAPVREGPRAPSVPADLPKELIPRPRDGALWKSSPQWLEDVRRQVHDATNGGADLVDLLLADAHNDLLSPVDRQRAISMLMKYGPGKPAQAPMEVVHQGQVNHAHLHAGEVGVRIDPSRLTDDEYENACRTRAAIDAARVSGNAAAESVIDATFTEIAHGAGSDPSDGEGTGDGGLEEEGAEGEG